ncbi:LysR family transcriptional regulator [Stella humosa]|uniref:LysR family transcriptional regulator n=1 Tax=Stella humosa TaxID=94 RepID=A0A3N1LGB9_9PROT|nr:LysR family transcriptional regulator [Stella humosa]ROP90537.1 LysR family transcriptional regulator [Stella humosa]BBK29568.1 LysR family transcriptional regulator [Stella humosa]
MDRLQSMEAFVKVVEQGSFAGAADALGLSRAMVSKHVAALEDRLGVRLLQRTTRRLNLTEVGRAYFDRSRDIIHQLSEAEEAASALQSMPRGTLRLNCSTGFGVRHLAPALAAFQTQYPDLQADVTLSDRLVDIVEDGYDLVIRIGRLQDSSLIARRLAPTRLLLCAAPAYMAARGEPAHPDELPSHNFLRYTYATTSEVPLTGPGGETAAFGFAGNLACNNGDALLAAALAGQGIVMLPTFYVGNHLAEGALKVVLPQWTLPQLTIYAVYPVSRHLAAKVRLFVDFLADRFRGEPPWDACWLPAAAAE